MKGVNYKRLLINKKLHFLMFRKSHKVNLCKTLMFVIRKGFTSNKLRYCETVNILKCVGVKCRCFYVK